MVLNLHTKSGGKIDCALCACECVCVCVYYCVLRPLNHVQFIKGLYALLVL